MLVTTQHMAADLAHRTELDADRPRGRRSGQSINYIYLTNGDKSDSGQL